ncbi:MAG: phospholipid carrier-dependent glycosyltransferase, partial [Actinomycetales bacterium]|nr:phospholipid carrier-dependent glycosyltransferase [Actinomycetales bacterium]
QALFGADSSFDGAFAAAVLGTLSILAIGRIARAASCNRRSRHDRGDPPGRSKDTHFVHPAPGCLTCRLFFALAAWVRSLIDRDDARARLATRIAADPQACLQLTRPPNRAGPRLWWRPWRLVAGICLGPASGDAWSSLYFSSSSAS